MKKVSTLLVLLALSASVFAQQKMSFGIKGSAQLCWLTASTENSSSKNITVEKTSPGFGYSYGVMLDYNIYGNLYFAPALNMTHITAYYTTVETTTSTKITSINTHNIDYLEIPLSAKGKTDNFMGMKFFGQVGVVPAVTLKASLESEPDNANATVVNQYKNTNKLNFGLLIGAGVEYGIIGNTALIGGISYHDNYVDASPDAKYTLKNHFVALDLGVVF